MALLDRHTFNAGGSPARDDQWLSAPDSHVRSNRSSRFDSRVSEQRYWTDARFADLERRFADLR